MICRVDPNNGKYNNEEWRGVLIEIYNDIHQGLVPDAEPFQKLK